RLSHRRGRHLIVSVPETEILDCLPISSLGPTPFAFDSRSRQSLGRRSELPRYYALLSYSAAHPRVAFENPRVSRFVAKSCSHSALACCYPPISRLSVESRIWKQVVATRTDLPDATVSHQLAFEFRLAWSISGSRSLSVWIPPTWTAHDPS